MKKIAISLIAALLVAGAAFAQDHAVGAKTGHLQILATLTQKLDLTPDQVSKISAAYHEMAPKMMAVKTNQQLSESERMAQAAQMIDEAEAQIKQILTPAQSQKLQAMGGLAGVVATAHSAAYGSLMTKLNLSADQTKQAHAIIVEVKTHAKGFLTDPKASTADKLTRMHALHDEAVAKLRAILTPAQQSILDSAMKEMGADH